MRAYRVAMPYMVSLANFGEDWCHDSIFSIQELNLIVMKRSFQKFMTFLNLTENYVDEGGEKEHRCWSSSANLRF